LPVRITATARAQYLGLVHRYLTDAPRRPARPQAAQRLIEAYAQAVEAIAEGPRTWLNHPRPYPGLARYRFRWIKIHRYWFAYRPDSDPVITNILDEASDIPAHVSADRDPVNTA
jgi:plasmid stabilization system protein ParE